MHLLLVGAIAAFTLQFKLVTCNEVRIKRGSQDVFNVLLNLYKIQPLKSSKIYKIFTDRVLLPNHIDDNTDHLYSNENTKEKPLKARLSLREIEKLIQASNPNMVDNPHFDVENVGSEKFMVDIVFNDTMKVEPEVNNNIVKVQKIENNFSSLSSMLNGLDSGESNNDTHITQEVPVGEPTANINYAPVTVINEVTPIQAFNNFSDTGMNFRPNFVGQYPNEIPNNYENADVIVI